MSGVNGYVFVEFEEFVLNRIADLCKTSAFKVGSPDRTVKQRIARNQSVSEEKTNASRSVPGGVDYFYFLISERENRIFIKSLNIFGRFGFAYSKKCRLSFQVSSRILSSS